MNIKTVFILLVLMMVSCNKKTPAAATAGAEQYVHADYDTTAIDSFSSGAISVDVAQRIRMSSRRYQDSLQRVREKEMEQKLKQEQEQLAREKQAAEKKKQEAAAAGSRGPVTENQ
ncbi:hypothetical protein [Chryseobacterium sp. MFBS3-17]|uniref:hypothetical protein n=1 Tax=Chryseobacterium sp. MFBS3-17 TaxID=2886689 RepID=UPI001D0EA12D|nr:hypothetical protein [Chryseobacterium sp. MFBS3-17]MCC2590453.1 hypothetical protein [Chryseobacterium sp. MFBS3-17]